MMPYAGEKVMRYSVPVLVQMCSSIARAGARLRVCGDGSVRVLAWLCARAGVALLAC